MLAIDENGRVYVVPEMREHPVIVAIPKEELDDVIRYVYHAYCPTHAFDIFSPFDRRNKVCQTYFTNRNPESFESQLYVKTLIKEYAKLNMTRNEVFLASIRKDMDEMLEHMRNIPLFKDGRVDTHVEVSTTIEDRMVTRNVEVKAKVLLDNSEEKFKVLKRLEDLLNMMERVEEKVVKERKEKKTEKRRIFDNS